MTARVVICCGSGGVGKTTVSAALALRFAREGHKVAVLTIDPARRLADSLGIGALTNTPRQVPLDTVDCEIRGSVDAIMLDAKTTFDDLVHKWSPDASTAERVLENRYYQAASARLGGSHEYMAMERLLQLTTDGDYDVVVLDTPPTRHALDFLRAPDRMAGLMDQGVLRWLIMPTTRGGWRALEFGSEAVARVLKRLIGRTVIGEIAEFFDAFRALSDRMRDRSVEVRALLRSPQTRFLLVTSPAHTARSEALFFLDVLQEEQMPFGGFLINRAIPAPVHPASALANDLEAARDHLPTEQREKLQEALTAAHRHRSERAAVHQAAIGELQAAGPEGAACWVIPEQPDDLHDLAGLISLAPYLPATVWRTD